MSGPVRIVRGRAVLADPTCPVCRSEICEDHAHAAPQPTTAHDDRVATELDRLRARRDARLRLDAEERAARTLDVPGAAADLLDDVSVLAVPEPQMLVADRIPADALALLVGPPGLGKSFVALNLAVAVATGRPWFGAAVTHAGPVIWVLAEGGAARFARRVAAAKMDAGHDLKTSIGLHIWPGAVPLLDASTVGRLAAAARDIRPVLVVFDTYSRCAAGLDENSAQETSAAVAALDAVREASGSTVLAIHHTPKDGRSEPRGSTALAGAVDTILTLQRAGDAMCLACGKQRDTSPFAPLLLRLVPVGDSVVPAPASPTEPAPLKDTTEDTILEALRREPLSGSGLARKLHLDRGLVFERLRRLEAAARITQQGEGPARRWVLL